MAVRLLVLVLTLAAVTSGCRVDGAGDGSSDGSSDGDRQGQAALDRHQADADDLAQRLATALEPALGPTTVRPGGFRECQGASDSSSAAFEYGVDLRVEAGPDAQRPFLDAARTAATTAGLDLDAEPRSIPGGGSALAARSGDLEVTFTEYPHEVAAGDIVTTTIRSPCIKIDPDDTAYWQGRD